MNKILHLFNETYVRDLFNQKVLPLYPEFKEIKQIKINPIKKNVWETTYHVVIEFTAGFLAQNGGLVELPIFCTAHSCEPRKNSFAALSFLWQAGFGQGDFSIPHPLFFSDYFNGFFYRGVEGQTLYHYLCKKNHQTIEEVVTKAAAWFTKLHEMSTAGVENFNPENGRIKTVVPGAAKTLKKIGQIYPRYHRPCEKIYEIINKKEEEYFSRGGREYLIHGDAHPRNIVKMGEDKIAVIDFTDMCLADFTRDLGTFLQQLEFMALKENNDQEFVEKIKKLFLKNYLANSRLKLDGDAKARIDNYYNWTAWRTATFFLMKDKPEPARGRQLLEKSPGTLKLKLISNAALMAVNVKIYDQKFFDNTVKLASRSAAAFVKILIKHFSPKSVVDIGCGAGIYLAEFKKNHIAILGFDGSPAAIAGSSVGDRIKLHDLCQPLKSERQFDLCLCLEVAEHLPASCARVLINTLTGLSRTIIFTAATPGQGPKSIGHINEQPHKHWQKLFKQKKFILNTGLTKKIKQEMAAQNVVWWLVKNLMILEKHGQ